MRAGGDEPGGRERGGRPRGGSEADRRERGGRLRGGNKAGRAGGWPWRRVEGGIACVLTKGTRSHFVRGADRRDLAILGTRELRRVGGVGGAITCDLFNPFHTYLFNRLC